MSKQRNLFDKESIEVEIPATIGEDVFDGEELHPLITVLVGGQKWGASFDKTRSYRWTLWRRWNECEVNQMIAFIGLNPSTADEEANDPTVRRCINFAQAWGFPGMIMLNAFAFRATDPKEMKAAKDPIGYLNERTLNLVAREAKKTVACWGTHGRFMRRSFIVRKMLNANGCKLYTFGLTKDKYPKHPLYLPNSSTLERW